MKCLFDPPPIRCPHDKGMEVKIYSSLSRVDTVLHIRELFIFGVDEIINFQKLV